MSDPTSAINLGNNPFRKDLGRNEFVIKDSEALVLNSLAAVDISTGLVEFMDDAANLVPCGMVIMPSDGNVAHLTGSSTYKYKAVVQGGIIVRWAVTGAAAITDISKPVYATDGQTMTLTKPTTGLPIGFVVNWISSTTCDVYLYSFEESVLKLAGSYTDYALKDFGTFPTNSLQGTAAALLWQETAYEHYKFISLHAQCVSYDDGIVAGSQVLNLDIGGTNVTGGALTVAYTDADAVGDQGAVINATAITAANEVHIGDTVKIEMAASGTGFTADKPGAFKIYAVIQKMPGA